MLPHIRPALSYREIAALTGLSPMGVQMIERRALRKLARHPAIVKLARECGVVEGDKGEGERRCKSI